MQGKVLNKWMAFFFVLIFFSKRFLISMGLKSRSILLEIKEKKNIEIMKVNILAFIAIALFILIPIAFLFRSRISNRYT
jgi:hypothetical protein